MLKRITSPGIFRLFLALTVFFHHISRFAVGNAAVDVFFCLSGYWIYLMYTARYSATSRPYFTYIVSRAWRLLPTFLLINIIELAYLLWSHRLLPYWNGNGHTHFVISNLFILGYESMAIQPIVPAWSLDIEMQFYIIAPLIIAVLAWRKMAAPWVLGALTVISLIAGLSAHNPVHMPIFLVFFGAGMVSASLKWRPSSRLAWGSLCLTLLVILACLASPWRGILLVGTHRGPLAIYTIRAEHMLALMMIPYAIFTTGQSSSGADSMFGDLSYIVYLLHWPFAEWVGRHANGMVHKAFVSLIALTVTLVASYVIWRFYDHPINRLRSRWVNSRRVAAVGSPRTIVTT